MIKTTITETTKKYDKEGHLIEETTRTETTEEHLVLTPMGQLRRIGP